VTTGNNKTLMQHTRGCLNSGELQGVAAIATIIALIIAILQFSSDSPLPPTATLTETTAQSLTLTDTEVPTNTATYTLTDEPTATDTLTFTPTNRPTNTTTPTYTPSNTATLTYTPTHTPTHTLTYTPSPTPTIPTNTPVPSATNVPVPSGNGSYPCEARIIDSQATSLNVVRASASGSVPVRPVSPNEQVIITDRAISGSTWYQITYGTSQYSGWIPIEYIIPSENCP
jgi:hypothetical protein